MNKRGFFITFEATDRAGKSIQTELLYQKLLQEGFDAIKTREPGGTELAEKIRELLLHSNSKFDGLTEAYLFATARSSHTELLLELMNQNKLIICDRFLDSSLTYQGVMRNLGVDFVREINDKALRGLTPDLTFIIDIDEEEFIKRSQNSDIDRIEQDSIKLDNFRTIRNSFKELAKDKNHYFIINGVGKQEDIHTEIFSITKTKLEEKGYTKTLK